METTTSQYFSLSYFIISYLTYRITLNKISCRKTNAFHLVGQREILSPLFYHSLLLIYLYIFIFLPTMPWKNTL